MIDTVFTTERVNDLKRPMKELQRKAGNIEEYSKEISVGKKG